MRKQLHLAFRQTNYRVRMPHGDLVLRVDQFDAALPALLRDANADSAVLLTAFNPDGRRSSPFRNREAQRKLQRELLRRGYSTLAGRNEDPRGLWPAEASFLVLGMPLTQAQQIAAQFGQAAFLWSDAGGTPRLIETAAMPIRKT